MKTRIKVVFCAVDKTTATWPHIGFDEAKRAEEWMAMLRAQLPHMEFSSSIYMDAEEARKGYEENEKGQYDGWLVCVTRMRGGVPEFYAENVQPLVIVDDLYAGSAAFLRVNSLVERKNLPVVTVGSSNPADTIEAVRLLGVVAAMKRSRVLIVSNKEAPHGATKEALEAMRDILGTQVEIVPGKTLQEAYAATSETDAAPIRDRWMGEALATIEPDAAEVLKSARMYLALKELVARHQADAVSVDCLNLFYADEADAYPCLGFFQMNNDGATGVCEGDLKSTLCQLLFRYLCNRPAYVSDPVIDEASGQIVYAHCVATNRPGGPQSPACPYILRSHAEDRKGASTQTLLPLGETVTTIALSPRHRAMALHTARTVGNVDTERACRTKLAAETDIEKVKANYHMELFGWHQTTCYGDWRRDMKRLARLYGLQCIEQDR